jgi:hypothetical protein
MTFGVAILVIALLIKRNNDPPPPTAKVRPGYYWYFKTGWVR